MTVTHAEPKTEPGRSLLRQWSGHENEPQVRIVVLAIESEAAAIERRATVERVRKATEGINVWPANVDRILDEMAR